MEDKNWLADRMHDVLGLYDETTARYLITLTKEASSQTGLSDKLLKEDLLPDTVKSRDFIRDLYQKFGKPVEGPSEYQKQTQAKVEQLKHLNRFKMLGDEDEIAEEGSGDEFQEIDKMAKFYKDLNAIKERNKEMKKELLKTEGENKLSKHEQKEVKKLLKEQDKLERQALVARMQQRDREQTDDKRIGQVVENQEIAGKETLEDLKSIVPELRK